MTRLVVPMQVVRSVALYAICVDVGFVASFVACMLACRQVVCRIKCNWVMLGNECGCWRHRRSRSDEVTTGGKVYRGVADAVPATSMRGGSCPLPMGVAELGTDRALSARRRNDGPPGKESLLFRRSRDCSGECG